MSLKNASQRTIFKISLVAIVAISLLFIFLKPGSATVRTMNSTNTNKILDFDSEVSDESLREYLLWLRGNFTELRDSYETLRDKLHENNISGWSEVPLLKISYDIKKITDSAKQKNPAHEHASKLHEQYLKLIKSYDNSTDTLALASDLQNVAPKQSKGYVKSLALALEEENKEKQKLRKMIDQYTVEGHQKESNNEKIDQHSRSKNNSKTDTTNTSHTPDTTNTDTTDTHDIDDKSIPNAGDGRDSKDTKTVLDNFHGFQWGTGEETIRDKLGEPSEVNILHKKHPDGVSKKLVYVIENTIDTSGLNINIKFVSFVVHSIKGLVKGTYSVPIKNPDLCDQNYNKIKTAFKNKIAYKLPKVDSASVNTSWLDSTNLFCYAVKNYSEISRKDVWEDLTNNIRVGVALRSVKEIDIFYEHPLFSAISCQNKESEDPTRECPDTVEAVVNKWHKNTQYSEN